MYLAFSLSFLHFDYGSSGETHYLNRSKTETQLQWILIKIEIEIIFSEFKISKIFFIFLGTINLLKIPFHVIRHRIRRNYNQSTAGPNRERES